MKIRSVKSADICDKRNAALAGFEMEKRKWKRQNKVKKDGRVAIYFGHF